MRLYHKPLRTGIEDIIQKNCVKIPMKTRLTVEHLIEVIKNSSETEKLSIFDLDGTIHRGRFARYSGYYANADLMVGLFSELFRDPEKSIRVFPLFALLYSWYIIGKIKFKIGLVDRSSFEKVLISFN